MADKIHPLHIDAPTPDPASLSHPINSSSHKQPPPPPPPSLAAHRLPGRRRTCCFPCCCCCTGWICSFLVSVVIFAAIFLLLLYLILRPRAPKFSVTDVHISMFNLTSKPLGESDANLAASAYLQADVNFTVAAENPNKRIGYYADQIDATLYYDDYQIGTGSVPPFYLGHKTVEQLQLEMIGKDTPLTQTTDSSLQSAVTNGSSIWLQLVIVPEGRIKIWWWKSRDFKLKLKCDVQISSAIAGKSVQLLSKSCKWRVSRFWFK